MKEHHRLGDKSKAPGKAYFKKITKFIDEHYEKGELYMEFVRGRCQTTSSDKTKCNFCINTCAHNNTPQIHGISQPKPDKSKLPEFHYLDVFATPLYNDEDGNTR